MSRQVKDSRGATLVAAVAVVLVISTTVSAQQLETRETSDGWIETATAGSETIRWRIVEIGEREPNSFLELVAGGEFRIETASVGDGRRQRSIVIDVGPCGGTPGVNAVYRHRGEAVAVITASYRGSTNRGSEYSTECVFAVALTPEPEVLFERHRFHGLSDWLVPSKPRDYRFVPMSDLLMVVMVGLDGVLPWPVGGQPADQSSNIARTVAYRADAIASMPRDQRSRLAPVSTVRHTDWAILQEPFTYPPRRVVVGGSRRKAGRSFSTELSYDGPRFHIETIRGTDDDQIDPWPSSGFPLADYRWTQREFGPQLLEAEIEEVAIGARKELHLLRWPCTVDRSAEELADDERLPGHEEWAVLLDMSEPHEVAVQTHLVRTCLTFQASPFFWGRGGYFRTFENGTTERIVEDGRTVGIEIHHTRPRILEWQEEGHLPDDRSYFEENLPHAEGLRQYLEGPETTEAVVLRIDR